MVLKKLIWSTVGTLSLGCGILGVFLPLIPTTPFLLLAAFCYAKSSPRLYGWLLNHKILGSYIKQWKEGRGIPLKSKISAVIILWITLGYSVFYLVPYMVVKMVLLAVGITVSTYIITRPTVYIQ